MQIFKATYVMRQFYYDQISSLKHIYIVYYNISHWLTQFFQEDVYVKKFYKKYPESKYHDAINYCPFSLSLVFVPFAVFEHLVLVSALLNDVLSCYVSGLWCNMMWPREKIGGEVLSFDSWRREIRMPCLFGLGKWYFSTNNYKNVILFLVCFLF